MWLFEINVHIFNINRHKNISSTNLKNQLTAKNMLSVYGHHKKFKKGAKPVV
jgi:hypothetical protein